MERAMSKGEMGGRAKSRVELLTVNVCHADEKDKHPPR